MDHGAGSSFRSYQPPILQYDELGVVCGKQYLAPVLGYGLGTNGAINRAGFDVQLLGGSQGGTGSMAPSLYGY